MSFKKVKKYFVKKYLPKLVGLYLNALAWVNPKLTGKMALAIFCTPRGGRIKDYQQKFLNTSNATVLKYQQIDIQTYEWRNEGPTIMLVHGWESNASRWKKLIKELLQSGYRVVALDAPAHGASGSKYFNAKLYSDLINVVAAYYQPAVIIGHSIGAYSSMFYCERFQPNYVKRLILLASPDKLTDVTNQYFKVLGLNTKAQQSYIEYFRTQFDMEMEKFSAALFAQHVKIPGAIVHDRQDEINFFYEGEAIHSQWINSNFYPVEGFGHALQSPIVYNIILDELKKR